MFGRLFPSRLREGLGEGLLAAPVRSRPSPGPSRKREGSWLATLLLALLLAVPAFADTLVVNVNGITLDERGRPQRFSALRFGPDGKVKALYQAKDKRPKTEYQIDG